MNNIVTIEDNQIIVANEIVEKLKEFAKQKALMDMQEKKLKEALKEAMENIGMQNFSINGMSASIRKATTRKSLDTKRMQEELPDIYEEYLKDTPVASSITLKFDI